jgi:hypothetical protein
LVKEELNVAVLFNADVPKGSLTIHEYEKYNQNMPIQENKNRLKSRNLILDFFSKEFGRLDVKNEYEYIYSAYYAYEIYNNKITEDPLVELDGVKFVSIANEYGGENYALSEKAFRSKIDFLGANFCYTYNNKIGKIENEGNAIIGRINSALLKDDLTFDWIKSTNDFDYIVKIDNEYSYLILQPTSSRFSKAVLNIGS